MMSSSPKWVRCIKATRWSHLTRLPPPLGSESICVRLVAPGNDGEAEAGRRVKFYVNGYEKQDFERFIKQNNIVTANDDGGNDYNLPVKLDFLRKNERQPEERWSHFQEFPRYHP